jgi:twinkle protein
MNVKDYLDSKKIDYRTEARPSGEQAIFTCPSCGDVNRFAINTMTGAFNCMRKNTCGIQGNFYQFQKLLGDEPIARPSASFVGKQPKVYKKPDVKGDVDVTGKWAQWLTETRKIPEDIIKKYKLRIGKDGRLGFVYRNTDGEIVNVKWRTFDKKFSQEKDAEPTLYGIDVVPDNAKEIIICEGEMDALSWAAYGYYAVSIPSGASDTRWIENDFKWLEKFKTIYISMDMDAAGQNSVMAIARRLGVWRTKSIKLPYKDANECLLASLKANEILEAILTAHEFKVPEIEAPRAFEERMIELLHNPDLMNGFETKFKSLDKTLRGWRMGEVTVWTGKNGTGKTTFLNQVAMRSMFYHELKVGIASLEMLPYRLLFWMMKQAGAPNTEKGIKEFLQVHDDLLYLVDKQGEVTAEELLEIMAYGTKKYGIKVWIIDSLMRIAMYGQNELQQQRQLMNQLTSFAREHEVHIHLVAHPRKQQSHMKNFILEKDDIGGSGVITDLAHNVIILHRTDEELQKAIYEKNGIDNVNLVARLAKNREFGTLTDAFFRFDTTTKNYNECS